MIDRDADRVAGRAVACDLDCANGGDLRQSSLVGVGYPHVLARARRARQREFERGCDGESGLGSEGNDGWAPNFAHAARVAAAARACNPFIDATVAVVVELVATFGVGHG